MNKKPPELPNIEDATLRACLAPLMDAMTAGIEAEVLPAFGDNVTRFPDRRSERPDAPRVPDDAVGADPGMFLLPRTLGEWRSAADEAFDAFRMVESFLAKTDVELEAAAAAFPKQIGGTLARLSRVKAELEARYEAVVTVQALLRRAVARVDARGGGEQ